MNFRPMVNVGGSEWVGNALVFATKEEAFNNASDLAMRWMTVRDFRADETDAPVNYSYIDRKLQRLEEDAHG